MNPKVAFLVYDSWKEARRKDGSFDGLSNIGAYMLIDAARIGGINIEFCSVDSAKKYDFVLVSFTSNYDILAYAKTVFGHNDFKSRKFKILGGGFGMQNPYPIQEYLDYVWFGRFENEIVWFLKNWGDVEHESLLKLPDWKICKINQSSIYSNKFNIGTDIHGCGLYQESIMGCPNKCFYCHFTWARKHQKTDIGYKSEDMYEGSQEIDWTNIDNFNPKKTTIIMALDGYSDKLRNQVNRNVTEEKVKLFYLNMLDRSQVKGHLIRLYNITGHEGESEQDKENFNNLIRWFVDNNKTNKNITFVLQHYNLHPSPITPIAYSEITIGRNLNNESKKKLYDTKNVHIMNSFTLETDYSLLESLVVERAQESTQKIFMDVVFNSKLKSLKSNDKIKALQMKHDITPLIREYDVSEQLPTWFIEGYTKQDVIKRLRTQMKRKITEYKNGNR